MPGTSELNLVGQFFEEQFKQAWAYSRAGQHDEANELCKWLLLEPALGDLHRAGAHLILAHSPDQKVAHATAALKLYKELYTEEQKQELSREAKAGHDSLIQEAERVLKQAEADEAEYGYGYPGEENDRFMEEAEEAAKEESALKTDEANNSRAVSGDPHYAEMDLGEPIEQSSNAGDIKGKKDSDGGKDPEVEDIDADAHPMPSIEGLLTP